jgi:hypothetical protein
VRSYQLLGLVGGASAVFLATLQISRLGERVYACYSPVTFLFAAALAMGLAPLFHVALRGLEEDPHPADSPPAGLARAAIAAAAFVMALAAVLDFDVSLDRSAPFETRFAVASHRHSDDDGRRRRTDLRPPPTWLAAQPTGLLPLPFHLTPYDEDRVVVGRTWIVIRMRAGAFGIPWFLPRDYRLEEDHAG